MEALNIKDLSFRYDSKSVVFKNLSLSLEEGEYVSIIGHNGSGKSTLAKLIIGLIEPQTGIISIFGEELDCSKPNFYELINLLEPRYKMISLLDLKTIAYLMKKWML